MAAATAITLEEETTDWPRGSAVYSTASLPELVGMNGAVYLSPAPSAPSPRFCGVGSDDYFASDFDPGYNLTVKDPLAPPLPIIRPDYPVIAQMVVGFAFGMMFSPWSVGIEFVLAFMIVYEIFVYVVTEGKPPYWKLQDRLGIIASYLLGWITGRILAGFASPFYDSPYLGYAVSAEIAKRNAARQAAQMQQSAQ